jgi:hypothetical protein
MVDSVARVSSSISRAWFSGETIHGPFQRFVSRHFVDVEASRLEQL